MRVERARLAGALLAHVLLLATPSVAPAQAAAQAAAQGGAAAVATTPGTPVSPRRASWTSDRRDYGVGDIITVLLDESTLATATKDQRGVDRQDRDMRLAADLPGGAGSTSPSGAMRTGKSSSSDQSGIARRNLRFVSEMSVRVVERDPDGLLRVEGTKLVDLDRNKQEFAFKGWVRPEDVSRKNVVLSARVANAELTYKSAGNLGKTRGGMIGRVLGMLWP
ncbi:MAG: hypothetical protein ABS52_05350 [Gemmatimonadetes bacterium SCN 70-22]|nr:MAG: hypothetical protein ABS52_05350 [Gemmatimonadetes bacterium SCN 70-22]